MLILPMVTTWRYTETVLLALWIKKTFIFKAFYDEFLIDLKIKRI